VRTPHIDRIAAQGIVFTNSVTNSPVCIPARFSLATGLYPHNTGVWTNTRVTLLPSATTWMQVLRDSGYHTSLFGKTHLHSKDPLAPHESSDLRKREPLLHAYGFNEVNEIPGPQAATRVICQMTLEWERKGLLHAFRRDMYERHTSKLPIIRPSPLGLNDYYDVYVAKKAARYLRSYNDPRPWFCWLGFAGPHAPYDTPEPYASMYSPKEMPEPVVWTSDVARGSRHRPRGWLDRKFASEAGAISPGLAKKLRANYAGSVTLIDDCVGEMVEAIRSRGELEQTAIVFSSDHGEMNGDFGLLNKSNMLDGAVRIPLLIQTPATSKDHRKRATIDDPVELMDIGPTIVEISGGQVFARQFGRSLVPVLTDPTRRHRSDAMVEHRHEIMLFSELWKMTLNRKGEPYLLFQRDRDPQERCNLAGKAEYRHVECELHARVRQRLDESRMRANVAFAGETN
jgi:arylsulfatase